jgi:hypothetical protein
MLSHKSKTVAALAIATRNLSESRLGGICDSGRTSLAQDAEEEPVDLSISRRNDEPEEETFSHTIVLSWLGLALHVTSAIQIPGD